jgi:hypothetical protein
MGADSDCGALFAERYVLQRCGSTLVPLGLPANIWPVVVVICSEQTSVADLRPFVPRYSGLDPFLLGLIIVIGPVDCVDNSHSCRWRLRNPVDDSWIETVDNPASLWATFGRPQAACGESAVTHRWQGRHAHVVLIESTAVVPGGQDKCPQSYPQGVDDQGGVGTSGWLWAGYRLHTGVDNLVDRGPAPAVSCGGKAVAAIETGCGSGWSAR